MPADRLKQLEERTPRPTKVEGRVFERWQDARIFSPEPEGDASENFSIAVPPPNVTGALHMGHALNASIQDVLIRLNRMRGGGQVDLRHRSRRDRDADPGREAARARGELARRRSAARRSPSASGSGASEYGGTIVEQFQRLGASLDYGDERFTMDERYVRAVLEVFVALYEKGYVYRDSYMVNWDPGLRSAISDLEVEQRTVEDTLYKVDYPLEGGSGSITIATVRPETMLADTAIAVHPEDER